MNSAPPRLRVENSAVFCVAFDTARLPACVDFIGVTATPGGGLAHFTDLAPGPACGASFSVDVQHLDPAGIAAALDDLRARFQGSAAVPAACSHSPAGRRRSFQSSTNNQ